MIGDALRYPLFESPGRTAFLVSLGSMLGLVVAIQATVTLYPVVLSVLPAAVALFAVVLLAGTLVGCTTAPRAPLASHRETLRSGAVAVALTAATMLFPIALLLGSVVSFTEADSGLEPGPPIFLLLGSTTALVSFLAAAYALPVLARTAVYGDRIGEGFHRARLARVLGSVSYFFAWTIGFPLVVGGFGLFSLAAATRSVGGLLTVALAAYLLVAGAHVLGAGYRSVEDLDAVSASPSAED